MKMMAGLFLQKMMAGLFRLAGLVQVQHPVEKFHPGRP